MKESLEQIYFKHHIVNKRRGTSAFAEKRGGFLRDRIGLGKKVLDIGCRDGVLTSTFVKGNDVLGLDIDQSSLDVAKEKLGIETKHLNLNDESWNVPQNYFDAAVAGEVLEHVYYPDKVVERVKSTLKDDGVFVGSVPNAFSLRNRLRLFLGQKRYTPLADPTHINHFLRKELESILLKHFKSVKIYPLGRFEWLDRVFPGMFSFMLLFEAKNKK